MALILGFCGADNVEVYYWYATIATLCMVIAYGMTAVGVIWDTVYGKRAGIPMRELIFPVLAVIYLAYVYGVQVVGQEAPYSYFPWIAAAWCLVGLVIVLSRPTLAERIGARMTVEDLD